MTAWENSRGKLNWFCKALSYSKDSLSFLLDKMKLPITVLVSLTLISDFVASASDWKQKAKILIKLEPSNLFVKCGNAEYTSKEIDNAANEACYRKFTKGKVFGIPVKPQPKIYKGNKLITFDEDSQSSHHFSRHTYHHRTHILKFDHHPFLMWPLENKLRHVNAKCFAIIQWIPERVRCKAIAVIMRERENDDIKCYQVTIRDTGSKYAGSSIYYPENPSLRYPQDPIPFTESNKRSNSVHGTTRVPPLYSNLQESNSRIFRTPSLGI